MQMPVITNLLITEESKSRNTKTDEMKISNNQNNG